MGGTSSIMFVLFDIFAKADLKVNLVKNYFCQSYVKYLGHKVGQGHVTPIMARVAAITRFPITTKRRN